MSWVDDLWRNKPPVPVIGSRGGLTQPDRRILLAYAQGSEMGAIAKLLNIPEGTFKRQSLRRLRAKLHATDARRMVKVGYEVGALELSHEPPAPVQIPQDYLDVLLLIADGYTNPEISAKLNRADGTTRTHVGVLAEAFAVERGLGSRTQLASRAFEFGFIGGAYIASPKP
jgi:DNA-binding NarL/FixJ family response regulator